MNFFGVLLIFLVALCGTLFSNEADQESNQQENIALLEPPKVLYLSHYEVKNRVIKGEIFPYTIKTLSTTQDYTTLSYVFFNHKNIKILNEIPFRQEHPKYVLETFYLQALAQDALLPDINATLSQTYQTSTLKAPKLEVIKLNPKKNFANIVAEQFKIDEFKTTSYDKEHNIIVLKAQAKLSDLSTFTLPHAKKQGIESLVENIFEPKITYFAIIDKQLEDLTFTYFNPNINQFLNVTIPIIVDDDRVVTQSDLKPKDQSKEQQKMVVAAIIAVIGFLLILWRKKTSYLLLIFVPLGYIIYLATPSSQICIKEQSNIYLLPMQNGTVFETIQTQSHFQKEGALKNFVKVKLSDEKIGWVKNEDICSH